MDKRRIKEHDQRCGSWPRMLFAAALMLAISLGCGKSAPPITDLSKAPWLDPKVQAEGLKHSDMRLRGLSALNLGKIGAPAADALPALESLAQSDPEPRVRELAQEAIEKIRAALNGQ